MIDLMTFAAGALVTLALQWAWARVYLLRRFRQMTCSWCGAHVRPAWAPSKPCCLLHTGVWLNAQQTVVRHLVMNPDLASRRTILASLNQSPFCPRCRHLMTLSRPSMPSSPAT